MVPQPPTNGKPTMSSVPKKKKPVPPAPGLTPRPPTMSPQGPKISGQDLDIPMY